MKFDTPAVIAVAIVTAGSTWCQSPETHGQNPLYRVTVIERSVSAVNYQYRSGPTMIDFRGTVLMPEAKGEATVESKAGRIEVDARFERVLSPARYGGEYLTYVLWAITPEGHAKNLGEVLSGSSDKAKLHVTTDLQAFGLIVTAEPYSAVRQPSDVVVMENRIRPDTIGTIKPIQAKYDLLPRGHYTYNIPASQAAAEGNGPKVPMAKYEEMLELYQAQNAVQIAGAMGAAEYAADTFARAQQLLKTAQDLEARNLDKKQVIANAREAAQTAEDARAITLKRTQDAETAAAKGEAAEERQRRLQAEAEAQTAKTQASADRAMLQQERSARQEAEARAAAAAQIPQPAPAPIVVRESRQDTSQRDKRDLRIRLQQELSASSFETTDTPRGIVVTIPAAYFTGHALQPEMAARLAQVAAAIAAHPGLKVEVDDNGESGTGRGESVRMALVRSGVNGSEILVLAAGNTRPVASLATAEGRELNRRVEIAITGDAIGNQPYWDRSYSLRPR